MIRNQNQRIAVVDLAGADARPCGCAEGQVHSAARPCACSGAPAEPVPWYAIAGGLAASLALIEYLIRGRSR